MDQVTLPLVVSEQSTFTHENDKDTRESAPSDALGKCQFTTHVICNAEERSDNRD